MPECGSQCTICDVPIRFDTYKGCSHFCSYCFAQKKHSLNKIEKKESVETLKKFIDGQRTIQTNWCDWNIPLHWGGYVRPFSAYRKRAKI